MSNANTTIGAVRLWPAPYSLDGQIEELQRASNDLRFSDDVRDELEAAGRFLRERSGAGGFDSFDVQVEALGRTITFLLRHDAPEDLVAALLVAFSNASVYAELERDQKAAEAFEELAASGAPRPN